MPSLETEKLTTRQMEIIQSAWDQIRLQLETEKARIYEEIGTYPPPIAACDQQFNFLLEERTRVSQELDRLNDAAAAGLTIEDATKRMDDFIQSSRYIDLHAGQTIWSSIQQGFSQFQA
jgi:hypothetical protein